MEVTLYTKLHFDKWNSLIENSKNGTFLFNRNFMEYHSDRFIDHSLCIYDKNELIACLPANISKCDTVLYSHQGLTFGGLIVKNELRFEKILQSFRLILKYLFDKNIKTLIYKATPIIYHRVPSDEYEWIFHQLGAEVYRKDLTLSIDYLFPLEFQYRRKRSINKALQLQTEIVEENDLGIETYWNEILIPNLMSKHGVSPVHSVNEIIQLKNNFPQNIKHFNIYSNKKLLAGCTLFINHETIHVQYISGSEEGKSSGCLDLLFATLIEKFKSNYRYFDFGICNENEGKKINFGLMDWKESFGARSIIQNFYSMNTNTYSKLDEYIIPTL